MGRVSEINRLTWDDVDLNGRTITLYTRKKQGGDLTPRVIPLAETLYGILRRRYTSRDRSKPWVFWHDFTDKKGEAASGPFADRKRIMWTLCQKAGVRYLRFHALRHAGASMLEKLNVPISDIQKILGHENRLTTEIYLHSFENSQRQAMAIFEAGREKSTHKSIHTDKKGASELSLTPCFSW